MAGGIIISGAAGLPRNFAAIEASSYREAIRGMKAAFQNPETTLVVWSNAGDLMTDDLNEVVVDVSRDGRQFEKYTKLTGVFLRHSRLEPRISEHFSKFAKGMELSPGLLQVWRRDTEELTRAIYGEFQVTGHSALLRLRKISKNPSHHRDRMNACGIVAFRVLNGDSTEYHRAEDVLKQTKKPFSSWPSIIVKPDAEIWRVPRGAIAFHSGEILHSVPSLQTSGGLAQGQKRLVEAHIFWAKDNFVACRSKQMKPL